jgi:hypothetical protein
LLPYGPGPIGDSGTAPETRQRMPRQLSTRTRGRAAVIRFHLSLVAHPCVRQGHKRRRASVAHALTLMVTFLETLASEFISSAAASTLTARNTTARRPASPASRARGCAPFSRVTMRTLGARAQRRFRACVAPRWRRWKRRVAARCSAPRNDHGAMRQRPRGRRSKMLHRASRASLAARPARCSLARVDDARAFRKLLLRQNLRARLPGACAPGARYRRCTLKRLRARAARGSFVSRGALAMTSWRRNRASSRTAAIARKRSSNRRLDARRCERVAQRSRALARRAARSCRRRDETVG